MTAKYENLIKKAYGAFNDRDINMALETMQPDIQWSKAWEGGYISGHNEIRDYWTRQWKEIIPNVQPTGFNERQNGSLEVIVHQNVKDLQNNLMFDGTVKHVYTFKDGLIKTMDIELVEQSIVLQHLPDAEQDHKQQRSKGELTQSGVEFDGFFVRSHGPSIQQKQWECQHVQIAKPGCAGQE